MSHIHPSSMTQPKSILVATDLNDLEFLLPEAVAQATLTGAMVWLLHVAPPDVSASFAIKANPFSTGGTIFRSAEATLAKAAGELRRENITCAYEVRQWFAVGQITEFIREWKIERLILGTSGRGKAGKFLLGSVAEELVRSLDIPVCTIGPHLKPFAANDLHTLVFATSLRHHPDLGFQFADDLAARLHAEPTILHVMEQSLPDVRLELEARGGIDEMLARAPLFHRQPRVRIRFGDPSEEILAECSALRPKFVILGALPATAPITSFHTGVAYKVISRAPCPTFTLRDRSETEGKRDGSAFSDARAGLSSF